MFTHNIGYWEVYRSFQGEFFLVVGGGVGFYVGGSFHGGRDITMKGVPDFPELFKKQ
jgi:hypothetical protein